MWYYLLSVNTRSFAEYSWFIIIIYLELLSKELILVLCKCSLNKQKMNLNNCAIATERSSTQDKFILPSMLAELLVHFFQISPTSRNRYCIDYLYDLKATNQKYGHQPTNQVIAQFWCMHRSFLFFTLMKLHDLYNFGGYDGIFL